MKYLEIENGKLAGFTDPKCRFEAEEFVKEIEETCENFITNSRDGVQTEIWRYSDGTTFRIIYKDDEVSIKLKDLGSGDYIRIF
jgi:hypothetical protein